METILFELKSTRPYYIKIKIETELKTLTNFATACAVFVGAAQGLKLQSLALVPTTVHRVEQYPNLFDYDAPDGLLAT